MRETCDVCHSQPAKNHLCEIIDSQQTSLDLCDDCLRERSAASGFRMPLLDGSQHCYYCGGQAQSAGKNLEWEEAARGELFHFTCFRCSQLYHQFATVALADLPSGLSAHDQIQALTRLIADTDKKVYERVGDQEA